FQAEDGIRDPLVTGVQTCALPILAILWPIAGWAWLALVGVYATSNLTASFITAGLTRFEFIPLLSIAFACYHIAYGYGFLRGFRSEERRVGKGVVFGCVRMFS